MIDFKNIIDKTFKDRSSWDYYSGDNVFDKNPMLSEESSKEFIKNFIKLSGKEENALNEEIDKIEDRVTHIVSTFFIGHYVYQKNGKIKKMIDEQLKVLTKKTKMSSDNRLFTFVWFLTCLFHDLGYAIEKSTGIKYISLEELKNKTSDLKEVEGIPPFYKEIHPKYYDYRIREGGKNDHGITAAYLMFHSLCKIRYWTELSGDATFNWEQGLEDIYNFCAWNILAHNIWFGDKNDQEKYRKYGMDELIFDHLLGDKYKITLEEYPFFFFLCLIDTIEPYKRIKDYEKLSKIKLKMSDEKIEIISELENNEEKKVLDQVESLKKWLIPTERTNKVTVFLTLKSNKETKSEKL
ncbi:hypothetical protein [Capnocytophaga canimorsus]|uniref:hypothetical protein n=1 Tax=Capnocytophaga canimorsus TaxID=28188 RepID=UPI001EDDE099|nr:hypothetical protein [Capnocytophaga canimorsus]GJQ04816.1 hypothetical protein CAPN009_12310 [Capnocytophaga canimorsus]